MNGSSGQNSTYPICGLHYQHTVVNYNGNFLNYTSLFTDYDNFDLMIYGFQEYKKQDSIVRFFTNGNKCKLQHIKESNIDTINTINWYNGSLPHTLNDSIILDRKIRYAYILYKFNEKRLNEDNNEKIRLLIPEDGLDGLGKWMLYKVTITDDSVSLQVQHSDIVDTLGRKPTYFATKKLKSRSKDALNKNLKILRQYEGYECFTNEYYPWLLEYFDGEIEHCFIISNKCKAEKILKKQYEKLIMKIYGYAAHI